jgi:peptidyl-tRNA hydrolase, PTH1 family
VAVHDELDLPFETMRVKLGGGDNGHNGLRSMRGALGTGDFYRVRIGIGRPREGRHQNVDFLLDRFTKREREEFDVLIEDAADAVLSLVTDGLKLTQDRFNRPGTSDRPT